MGTVGNLRRLLRVAVLVGIATVLVGVPLGASANPDIAGFELDGNAAVGGANDWENADSSALEFTGFLVDSTNAIGEEGFTTGGSKDTRDIGDWRWVDGQVTPAKDNIANAYAAVYTEDSNLILYFGQNRVEDQMGDANVGFWFTQGQIGLNTNGTFSGSHQNGDLLVQSEFTNGGVVSGVQIYKWQNGGLSLVSNQAQCAGGKLGTADACAIVNTGSIPTSWAGSIPPPYFFEGGLNLTAVYGNQVPCFSTFLTNTRTSQSESAQLKDFAMGDIDTCASLKISKVATPSDGTQFGYATTGGLNPSTFSLTNGGTQSYTKLQPGSYSVSENAPSGSWVFDSLSCPTVSGDGTSVQIDGRAVSVTLGFLGHVECTYVNKRKPRVKVLKVTDPTTDSGKFDLQINGTTHADDVGNGGDTGFKDVDPGQVSVGELAGTGTSLSDYVSSVSCDSGKGSAQGSSHSFSVALGEEVTCTIANRRKPEVKVVKSTNPANDPGKFNLLVNGNVERADAMNGQDTGFKQVAAGQVSVGESAGTGTNLADYVSSVSCDSGKGSAQGTDHSFTVGYGDKVTCTITNTHKGTLVVYKQVVNDNGGSAGASAWTMNVAGPTSLSFSGSATGTSNAVLPGSYTVGESGGPAGYAGPAYPTSGLPAGVSQNDCNAQGEVSVAPGEVKHCVLRNDDQQAKLIVIKHVVNDDGGTAVAGDFTMTVDDPGSNPPSFPGVESPGTEVPVDPGAYSVSESNLPGYQASFSADCQGTLALGQTKTCTVTNDDLQGTLIVIKHVVNDNGGSAVASAWQMNVAGPTNLSFAGAESPGVSSAVDAGAYKVTESGGPAGYALSYSGDCDADGDVTVGVGQTKSCTLTNDDQQAKLIVIKHVVNDNGGSAVASDFQMSVDDPGSNPPSFPGAESPGTEVAVDPGAYSVSESNLPGYQASFSADCQGTLALGQTKTCTVTNDDLGAKLIVIKHVVNDNGGTAVASDFQMSVDDAGSNPPSFPGAESPGTQVPVDPGAYSVSESNLPGYDASLSADCQGTIALGETKTCTVTNDDKPGTLIVIKHVVNDNGGGASASDWQMNVAGPTALSFDGVESPGVSNQVDAGAYRVTESGGPDGYALEYSGDCDENGDVTVGLGQTKTCTLTNDDVTARLIVIKHVVNDHGGQAVASSWDMNVAGPTNLSFLGAEAPGASNPVDAGAYKVTESGGPAGYDLSYSADCDADGDVTLALGETKTCTLTNDDQPAELIVKKVVVNDNGGNATADDFSFTVNGGQAQPFEADGQNNLVVAAGTYNVIEPAVAGYTTSYSNCSNLVIPLGGSATCTVTNNDVPRGQGSIQVSKSADPITLKEPGGQVTYSVRITNTSVDVDVSITNVVDDKFGDLDDDGGNGCFDVPINLAPGQFSSCQFTKQITGVGGTSHVNTVTASGHDESGHPLSASDDARVDITPRLIDLVIVKDATSPTQLNGVVNYTMTVTNKGPDTATNVQLADPAPAGITYLSATPSQGSCSVSPALITCDLDTIAAGQTVTVKVAGKATQVGRHVNTATVTGSGGRETNPADNVDDAVTVVPAPIKPPTPKPTVKPEVCLTLTVSPKMAKADGKVDRLVVKVTAAGKPVKGAKVLVTGAGVRKTAKTNGKGIAVIRINAKKPGLVTVTTLEKQKSCGPKRIGVVGVFLPPLTG